MKYSNIVLLNKISCTDCKSARTGTFQNYNREWIGNETKGEVISIKGFGRTQRIEFKFTVDGKLYYGKSTIKYSGCRENNCVGYSCIVIYDKEDPNDSRVTRIIID